MNDPENHPAGSRMEVRYDPAHPGRAEYVHHGSRVFVNLLVGLLSVMGSLVLGAVWVRARLTMGERPPGLEDAAETTAGSLDRSREPLSGG